MAGDAVKHGACVSMPTVVTLRLVDSWAWRRAGIRSRRVSSDPQEKGASQTVASGHLRRFQTACLWLTGASIDSACGVCARRFLREARRASSAGGECLPARLPPPPASRGQALQALGTIENARLQRFSSTGSSALRSPST